MMKLLITIVQNDDVAALTEAIVKSGHSATKLSSSGGILRSGNTTLLIGVEDTDVEEMLDIIRSTCRERKIAMPDSFGLSDGTMPYSFKGSYEVIVGGATIFILDVEQFIHL